MRSLRIGAIIAAAALALAPVSAAAQAVTGTLLGNVTDQGGLSMPGATVTITETTTNISLNTTTNEAGLFRFPSLKDGRYKVVAELAGFKRVVRDGIIVEVNTTIRVDIRMEVGALEESITVVGQSPILQTDRTDTGRIMDAKMVSELPLTFNRNFQSALITVPGSTRPHREHSAFFNSQDSLAVEINGQPRMANNTLIEGLDNNQKTGLLQVIIPAADALETVNVSTSNYDAEFGRSGGAITNVTLKSGTNTLKGSGFVFGNTDKTNASEYFTHLKAPTKFLNSGFTLGGPIVRNRFIASCSVLAKPSSSATTIGKNVTRMTTSTFGSRPKPNQMIMSGAIAMIGIVCEPTSIGYSARRSHSSWSITTAKKTATAIEAPKPTAVSFSVCAVCCHARLRKS